VIWQIEPLGPWGRPVTRDRAPGYRFRAGWTDTLDLLGREIDALGCRGAVALRVDVQRGDIRRDGMLRADARTGFPGVVLSFESRHGPLSYATDAYDSWQANVRAIALSLQALRAVDRYGVSRSGEQYAGWRAIGDGKPEGFASADAALRWLGGLVAPGSDVSFDDAPALIRRAATEHHPDRTNGDRAVWDRIDAARQLLATEGGAS
jgi:hypothetical protein